MNELDNGANADRQGDWWWAIGNGVIACILVASMMSVAFNLFLPEIAEGRSILSHLCRIAIWLISIGLGIWQVVKYRPKD